MNLIVYSGDVIVADYSLMTVLMFITKRKFIRHHSSLRVDDVFDICY